jgi:hypothetical protein
MKKTSVLLASLVFASSVFAQAPATAHSPVQVAQAGGPARGAGLPPATTGAGSTVAAMVAFAIAGVAAAASYQSTVTTPSHH